ncbi:MAG: hypothetical protein Q9165_004182 [Trypethelium subeluteriae]
MGSSAGLEEGEIEEGEDTDILEHETYCSDHDSMDLDPGGGRETMSLDDMDEVVHFTPYPDRDMVLVRRYMHRRGETFCEVYFHGSEVEEDLYKLINVSTSEIDLLTLPGAAAVEGEQFLVNETNPLPGQLRPYFHGGFHTGCALFHHKTTYRYPALELLRPGERAFFTQPADCQSRHHPGAPPRNPQEHSFFTISEVYPNFAQRKLDGDKRNIISVIEWLTRMPGRTEFSFVTTMSKGISIFRIRLTSHFMRHPFDMEHVFELTKVEWDALPAQSRDEAVCMEEAAFAMDFRALEHSWYDRRLRSQGWEGGLQWLEGMDDAELFNFVEWHYNCTELYELSTDRAWHEVVHQLSEHGMHLPEFPWKERTRRVPVSEVLLEKVEVIHPSELQPDQTQCGICTTDFAQLNEFPAKFNCRCGAIFGLACLLDWHSDIVEGTVKTCPICRDAMYTQDEVVNDLYPVWQNNIGVEWIENNKDLDWALYPRLIPWDFRYINVNAAQLVLAFNYVSSMSTDSIAMEDRTPSEPEAVELDGDFCVRNMKSNDIIKDGRIYRVFFNRDRWGNEVHTDDAWNAWLQWRADWTARKGYAESLEEDL